MWAAVSHYLALALQQAVHTSTPHASSERRYADLVPPPQHQVLNSPPNRGNSTSTPTTTPDLGAILGDTKKAPTLYGLFVGATLPTPANSTCDNSQPTVAVPCLNAPPPPGDSAATGSSRTSRRRRWASSTPTGAATRRSPGCSTYRPAAPRLSGLPTAPHRVPRLSRAPASPMGPASRAPRSSTSAPTARTTPPRWSPRRPWSRQPSAPTRWRAAR